MGEKENEREEFIHAIRKFMEMRTLTKQVLNELIDHIDVCETQGTDKQMQVIGNGLLEYWGVSDGFKEALASTMENMFGVKAKD